MTYTAPNRPAVWYRGLFRDRYAIDIHLDEGGREVAPEASGRAHDEDGS